MNNNRARHYLNLKIGTLSEKKKKNTLINTPEHHLHNIPVHNTSHKH